jgi:AraC-like DNA-binding protein
MKTPIFNIHDLILILTVAVCALLAIFQWVLSKQKMIASQLLAGFFVCVGASALCNMLLWNIYIESDSAAVKLLLSFFLVATVVGKSLFLFLYVLAITRAQFRWRGVHILHGILLVAPLLLVITLNLDSDKLRYLPGSHNGMSTRATEWLWHYLKWVPVIYAFAAVLEVVRYKRQLKEFYSALSLRGPSWLLLLVSGFAVNWLWSLGVHILGQSAGVEIADGFGIADNYLTFLLVNALFIYSLLYAHRLLVTEEEPKSKETQTTAEPSPEAIARIRNTMENQQMYLKQNLTIEEFARQVGIHYREVSSIINSEFNTNFFEFVNEYRVNRAKQLLLNPTCARMTILDILLESGFNSKSAFHRFFKRYTGMSAAEFRKQAGVVNSTDAGEPRLL